MVLVGEEEEHAVTLAFCAVGGTAVDMGWPGVLPPASVVRAVVAVVGRAEVLPNLDRRFFGCGMSVCVCMYERLCMVSVGVV